MVPGVSDGSRLNLAAQLAEAAADLQKVISTRKGKAGSDAALLAALTDVGDAVWSLCSAVRILATEVEEAGDDRR